MNDHTRKAYMATNTAFCIADVMEMALMDMDAALRAIGMELRYKDRQDFNTAIKAVRRLRSAIDKTDMENQLMFGDSADEIYKMILAWIDEAANNQK